jgi:hypothetical protein
MLVDPDGRQLDDYFDQNGNYLYTDNKTSDEIRIIHSDDWKQIEMQYCSQINDKTASHAGLNKALESRSTGIAETKLSGEAVRKIFKNIIERMPDINMSVLDNSSLSTWDDRNPTNITNNGSSRNGEATTRGLQNGKFRVSVRMTGGYVPADFNTVSNVQNALGAHEYLGHGVMGYGDLTMNHRKAYELQMTHPTWANTSGNYKNYILDNYQFYLKPPR